MPGSGAFPKNLNNKLVYTDHYQAGSASGGASSYQRYHLNSLFDPYAGIGGHQPRGYDQLTPIYEKWLVTHVTVRIDIVSFDAANSGMVSISTINGNDTPLSAVWTEAEKVGAKAYLMQVDGAKTGLHYARRFSVASLFGKTASEYSGDANNWGIAGANPTNLMDIAIGTQDPFNNGQVDAHGIITLVYEVKWADKQSFAFS